MKWAFRRSSDENKGTCARFGVSGYPTIILMQNGMIQQYKGKKEEKNIRAYLYQEFHPGEWRDIPEYGLYARMMGTYSQVRRLFGELLETIGENPSTYLWLFAGGLVVLGILFLWLVFTGEETKGEVESQELNGAQEQEEKKKKEMNGGLAKEKSE